MSSLVYIVVLKGLLRCADKWGGFPLLSHVVNTGKMRERTAGHCFNKCYRIWIIFQMERDDSLTEIEILKDKIEKAQLAMQKATEDKDVANKEFERILEKFDR